MHVVTAGDKPDQEVLDCVPAYLQRPGYLHDRGDVMTEVAE